MPRTPSMTPAEAEALLGSRGLLAIKGSEQKNLARKYITARGVPASRVSKMRKRTLEKCYNSERYIQAVIRNCDPDEIEVPHGEKNPGDVLPKEVERHIAEMDADDDVEDVHETPAPKPSPKNGHDTDVAGELARVLARLTPAVNEDRIVELIHEHAPKPGDVTKTIHITIGKPDGEIVNLDGLVHYALPKAIKYAQAGNNVYLVGPAGSGKTTLAEQVAKALDLEFYVMGACDTKHSLVGYRDANGNYVETEFYKAFTRGGLILLDEIDAYSPGALLALSSSLSNGYASFPCGTVSRHPDFRCIAAANTYGRGADRQYVGRNQLDAASLDRFIKLAINYDKELELAIAREADYDIGYVLYVQAIRESIERLKLRHIVSPRATIFGGRLLKDGCSLEDIEEDILFSGLDQATIDKIKQDVPRPHIKRAG